jgi:hypothetical protein
MKSLGSETHMQHVALFCVLVLDYSANVVYQTVEAGGNDWLGSVSSGWCLLGSRF